MKPRVSQLAQSGATDGQVLAWDDDNAEWAPTTVSSGGSGVAGVTGELLMQDGVTAPPVPIETEARDDWLYQDL